MRKLNFNNFNCNVRQNSNEDAQQQFLYDIYTFNITKNIKIFNEKCLDM